MKFKSPSRHSFQGDDHGGGDQRCVTVSQLRGFPRDLWVNLILEDQAERWRRGDQVLVESYLESMPELNQCQEDVLVMICGEVQLRTEMGIIPSLAEYQHRFPSYANEVALQFEINEFLATDQIPADRAPIPIVLEGYQVLDEIACGAFGVVYRAKQLSPLRLVAIKAIEVDQFGAKHRARQLREADIIASIQHPHVIRIYEAIRQVNQLYLVMEYIDGPTLAQRIANSRLSVQQSVKMLVQLCEAIEVVHSAGVIHRDLKPANVLLMRDDQPVITDFGLAKWFRSSNISSTEHALLGTPSYMSPEQTSCDAPSTPAMDVYSLGAILYELFTGRPPIAEPTVLATLVAIGIRDPVPPRRIAKGLPRDLDTVVMKAIARQPEKRYTSARELADDLQRYLDGRPILARRVRRVELAWRWCRRNPAIAGLGAALVMVLMVGGLISFQLRQGIQVAQREAGVRTDELLSSKERLQRAFSLIDQARSFVSLDRWDDAMDGYSRAIELRPDLSEAYDERGGHYMLLSLTELAAEDIRRAFELRRPSYSGQWLRHGLLRLYVEDHQGYRQTCVEMHDAFNSFGNPIVSLDLARTCAVGADCGVAPEATLLLAQSMVDRDPTGESLHILALAQYRAGQFDKAVKTAEASTQMNSDVAALEYPILAMAHHFLGHHDQAIASLQSASVAFDRWIDLLYHSEDTDWPRHYGAATNLPIPSAEWLEFLVTFREATRSLGRPDIQDPRLHVIRARSYAALRRTQDAVDSYSAASVLAPADSRVRLETHRSRGFDYVTKRQHGLAAREYQAATRLAKHDPNLWRFLAIAQLASGNISAYQQVCREMVQRFGHTNSPDAAVTVIEVCACRRDALNDWQQLLPLAHLAENHLPDSMRFGAAAQFRAGDSELAVRTFVDLEIFCRLRAVDLFLLAMAYHDLGQNQEAIRRFDQATAWIREADQRTIDSPFKGSLAWWGAWTEHFETQSLQREAEVVLGIRPE